MSLIVKTTYRIRESDKASFLADFSVVAQATMAAPACDWIYVADLKPVLMIISDGALAPTAGLKWNKNISPVSRSSVSCRLCFASGTVTNFLGAAFKGSASIATSFRFNQVMC